MVLMNIKPLYCGGRLSKLFSFNSYFLMIFISSRACGIEDEGTLIITGGGSNGFDESMASNNVERYNRQV